MSLDSRRGGQAQTLGAREQYNERGEHGAIFVIIDLVDDEKPASRDRLLPERHSLGAVLLPLNMRMIECLASCWPPFNTD